MGRKGLRGRNDVIKCRVCDKLCILNNEKFRKIFQYSINQDLSSALDELSYSEYKEIKEEVFYQHLNFNEGRGYGMCPNAICEESENKGMKYELFENRYQRNYHIKKHYKTEEQMKGKTGYTNRIREEVMRQCQRIINQMQEEQSDWIFQMPNIEVNITDYKMEKKSEHMAKLSKQKQEEKQENKKKLDKKRKKKEHEDTLAQLQALMEEAGIED